MQTMPSLVRLNLIRPRRITPGPPAAQRALVGLGIATLIGLGFGAGVRWIAGDQVAKAASDSWEAASQTDLALVAAEDREALERVVSLANEYGHLRRAKPWLSFVTGSFGRLLGQVDDSKALTVRGDQLEVALRGEIEGLNQRLEHIVKLPAAQRDAALRILAFGRWRLLGGTYEDSSRHYDARKDEISKRPAATATPTVTNTPTAAPATATPKRGRR